MAGAEDVVLALVAPQEAGEPAALPERGQPLVAPGQDLPGVALVPHVEQQLVARRVETVRQGHGELDYAQSRADVTARLRHHVDETLAHLVCQLHQLLARQLLDVGGLANGIQQLSHQSATSSAPRYNAPGR